jgi:hypothetical protein
MSEKQKLGEPKGRDFVVSVTVTRGPEFFDKKKHQTRQQKADLLKAYAAKYDGVLREVFLLWALHPLVDRPPIGADDPGGDSQDNFSWDYCGSCSFENGSKGRRMIINGVPIDCYDCGFD